MSTAETVFLIVVSVLILLALGNWAFSVVAERRNPPIGTFTECALESGAALTSDGKGLSGMGTVFQDYDNDGKPDVIVTVLPRELFAEIFQSPFCGRRSDRLRAHIGLSLL